MRESIESDKHPSGSVLARVRIDKWMWAARFFKTRSLAAQAVQKGRVKVAGETVKPARDLQIGDLISIEIDRMACDVIVKGLSEVRGPAPVARLLYEETGESVQRRVNEIARRKLFREPAMERDGRPSKRDRRVMDKAGVSRAISED